MPFSLAATVFDIEAYDNMPTYPWHRDIAALLPVEEDYVNDLLLPYKCAPGSDIVRECWELQEALKAWFPPSTRDDRGAQNRKYEEWLSTLTPHARYAYLPVRWVNMVSDRLFWSDNLSIRQFNNRWTEARFNKYFKTLISRRAENGSYFLSCRYGLYRLFDILTAPYRMFRTIAQSLYESSATATTGIQPLESYREKVQHMRERINVWTGLPPSKDTATLENRLSEKVKLWFCPTWFTICPMIICTIPFLLLLLVRLK
ncbi:hypothetical protein BDV96DRAFT_642710 [Lophiotrema nucula]|uniref:Uncharacterized protein n=1 Tax=Lophiotrema nucula TaxID=690887 RepID=A0A6A5ZML9_9PLEO|nr:hypothetical protein BDV96DRAFT_642710 [Lophiotrema nucula]